MQQRVARHGGPDLELQDRPVLEALDDQQGARREVLHLLVERRLLRAAQLVHEHPAPRRGDQYLARAGVPVAVGVLAGLVDVEAVVRVLDERNLDPMLREARDQLLDQRGFAAARPAGEAEGFHAGCDATPAASWRRQRRAPPPAPGERPDWRI